MTDRYDLTPEQLEQPHIQRRLVRRARFIRINAMEAGADTTVIACNHVIASNGIGVSLHDARDVLCVFGEVGPGLFGFGCRHAYVAEMKNPTWSAEYVPDQAEYDGEYAYAQPVLDRNDPRLIG